MTYEPREGSLSLFKNDKKDKPTSPDWRGNGLFMGKKVKIAAWQKQTSKGETFFSIKIEEDNYKPQNVQRKDPPMDDLDADSIPFMRLMSQQIASW